MDFSISFDDGQLKKLEKDLGAIAGASQLAMTSALNKAVVGMRTDAVRAVTRNFHIGATAVRRTMSIKKALLSSPAAILKSVGPDLPAAKFKLFPSRITKPRPAGGVKVQVRRSGPAEARPHSFIAVMRSGHAGVFVRRGRGRFPIDEVRELAIPTMIAEVGKAEIEAQGAARLAKELDNQIVRILAGKVGRR